MRSVEDQQSTVTAAAVAPRPVRVAISESQGLLCAEDVVADNPVPGFDQAAVDGYAVRSIDVSRAGDEFVGDDSAEDVVLPVVGEIFAGSRQPIRLQPHQTVWVATGAPLPTLADAVVPTAWIDGSHHRIVVRKLVRSGDYVRRVGVDVSPGDVAVRAGAIIGPAQVGLLAAVGRDKVLVHPRPRLSVIAVGGEMVDIDRVPGLGQVFDINSYALASAARDAGADVNRVGIVPMDQARLREVVEGQLIRSEVVVLVAAVGGVASQQICDALVDLGRFTVDRVAMYPGSVQGFGRLGRDEVPTFLLPSNPVSALVVFEVMIRPLIRIALGRSRPMRRMIRARTIAPIMSISGRRGFLRAKLMRNEQTGEYLVEELGAAASPSHLLATLAEANALIVVDPEATEIPEGDEVDVMFLAQRG